MNRSSFAILSASLYLLAYIILLNLGLLGWAWIFFSISLVVLIAMVCIVIRYGEYTGHELKEDEEWGYEDYTKE